MRHASPREDPVCGKVSALSCLGTLDSDQQLEASHPFAAVGSEPGLCGAGDSRGPMWPHTEILMGVRLQPRRGRRPHLQRIPSRVPTGTADPEPSSLQRGHPADRVWKQIPGATTGSRENHFTLCRGLEGEQADRSRYLRDGNARQRLISRKTTRVQGQVQHSPPWQFTASKPFGNTALLRI